MGYIQFNQKTFDLFSRFSFGVAAVVLLSFWAFFEASVWFLFPDFLLFILVILNPKKWRLFFIVSLVLSILGLSAYYLFVYLKPSLAYTILINTPFVGEYMLEKVVEFYQMKGSGIALIQAFYPIPSKVWTYETVVLGFKFLPYLLMVTISRAMRMFLVSYVGSRFGKDFKGIIRNNFFVLFLVYVIMIFTVLFLEVS
ncbi:MAG: hypothetical protein GY861_23570 [bacterium]|nr:hypothetical protein [bacterium]